ncbi:hypothetical protein, partial [Streptomonospora sediminis]
SSQEATVHPVQAPARPVAGPLKLFPRDGHFPGGFPFVFRLEGGGHPLFVMSSLYQAPRTPPNRRICEKKSDSPAKFPPAFGGQKSILPYRTGWLNHADAVRAMRGRPPTE